MGAVLAQAWTRWPRGSRAADLPAGFEVIGQPGTTVDPSTDPDRVDELLDRWAQAGATVVDLHVVHHSLDHYLEQLEALAA